MPDLKTPDGIRDLMHSSKNPDDWNANCDAIKAANGGNYPSFWFATIILSGLSEEVARSWGDETALDIKITTYP
jgi:hypothetical protein